MGGIFNTLNMVLICFSVMDKETFKTLNQIELEDFYRKTGESLRLFGENGAKSLSFPFEPVSGDRVIFYPGSFSPWHKGHRACLSGLKTPPSGKAWDVVIAPDYNPWKDMRETNLQQEVLTLWEELESISVERADLNFHLYLGFLAEKKKNPTNEWMRKVSANHRWMLMGEDSFLDLDQWIEVEKLLSALEGIFVVPREAPADRVLEQREKILTLKKLEIEFLDHHKYEHFSSTFLREKK